MSDNTEIVRRKFTLPETLDQDLVTMANNHYTGNVSLCLRQAIQDHKASLAGESRLTLKRLNKNVRNIQDGFADLKDVLEMIGNQVDGHHSRADSDPTCNEPQELVEVREELVAARNPLRTDDIADRLGMSRSSVQTVLGKLIDLGYVIRSVEDSNRYRLAACVSEPESGVGHEGNVL